MPFIDVEVTDSIGFICLNNPAKRNALSREMVEEMLRAFDDFKKRKIATIILRAPGDAGIPSATATRWKSCFERFRDIPGRLLRWFTEAFGEAPAISS